MTLVAPCAIFLALSIALSRFVYSTSISPPVSYFVVYLASTTIFLALTDFGVLQLDGISETATTLLYFSWAAFFLGCFLEPLVIKRRRSPVNPNAGDLDRLVPWAWFVGCISFIGVSAAIIMITLRFGNPLISTSAVRGQMGTNLGGDAFVYNPAISIALYANYIAIIDWIILAIFLNRRFWKHTVAWTLMILFLAHSSGLGGAIFVTSACFGSAYLLCSLHRQRRISHTHKLTLAIALVAFLGVLTVEANLRSYGGNSDLGDTTVLYDGIYAGGTMAALQDSVDNPPHGPFPGFYTMSVPYKFVNMASRILLEAELYKTDDVNHPFDIRIFGGGGFYNSCPSMGWWYSEWGLGGAVFLSLVMGLYSSWIFRRAVGGGEVLALEVGALSWTFLLLTYREGFFDDPWAAFWIIVLLVRQVVWARMKTPVLRIQQASVV